MKLKFSGMDKNGFIAIFFVLIFVSTNSSASLVFHLRKLKATEHKNASATLEVSPIGSPSNESNSNPMNTGKPQQDEQKGSQMGNQTNNNMTSPIASKGSSKPDNDTKTLGAPSGPVDKNENTVDKGTEKANVTRTNLGDNESCEGSMISCRDQDMVACVQASNDSGSNNMFLVVKNEGDNTLKVDVLQVPDNSINTLPAFEVLKHKTRRIDISSTMGKSTELIVTAGDVKCVLPLIKSVSVENLIHQLSFYSKQVTPIYAVYASFVVALLLGGAWACCRLRKRNQQNGIPYQELEMGLPESSSAANLDDEEGWDDNWDDDWDEDSSIKSPSSNQVRSVSADGLVSRSAKKEGWEDDWED